MLRSLLYIVAYSDSILTFTSFCYDVQKLTEADLLELEKVWEMNCYDEEDDGAAATEPVQMQLFYGAKQTAADTSMESNALEAGSDAPLN